jgi:glycerol-3-phosphate O-acyltransferase
MSKAMVEALKPLRADSQRQVILISVLFGLAPGHPHLGAIRAGARSTSRLQGLFGRLLGAPHVLRRLVMVVVLFKPTVTSSPL